ncbi:MAG: hypothetical protein NZ920_05825 [Aigarchaeota archaeon]|nr:hypothetical protein [Aigarchaeota archaeon]MDW8092625.1 hypothetical protein [Nitrososphaerota archaeon]
MKRTVDVEIAGCDGVEGFIAYHLSEALGTVGGYAFVKKNRITIDLSEVKTPLTPGQISDLLVSLLRAFGLDLHCNVSVTEDGLMVSVVDCDAVRNILRGSTEGGLEQLYQCPVCGYITPYRELLSEHEKLHYVFI